DGKKDRWRYRWNADGSLAKVIRPDKREVEFTYDALGRRLSKSFGTTVTRWVWNGNVPLHQWKQRREYSVVEDRWNTDTERRDMTVWLFDEESFVPVAMIKEGRSYSILTDQLGTPTEAYDAEGNEVWSRVLDMDGNVIGETGNKGMVPFLFQGQYYDRETGLAYNRFRYYSPKMGMYVSQDPIGLNGSNPTIYGYVDDTNTWIDILGLAPWGRGNKAFNDWWDKATVTDIEANIDAVKTHLRGSGGMHEMFPVHLAPKLKDLGFTASELKKMVIPTKNMQIKIGRNKGLHHRSSASSIFHQKLANAITNAKSKQQAQSEIERLHNKHVVGYSNKK
ncbi:RHS repeat domain-containing protein, partial [Bacteroides fragilis]